MSLINDALKKAQRERAHPADRAPSTTPPAGTPPPAHPAGPRQELRSKGNPWLLILVAVGVIGGGTAVWFLKPGAAPAPAQTAAAPAAPSPVPAPATPATEPEMPQLTINLAGTTPPQPVPAPTPSPLPVAPPATTPPTAPVAKTSMPEAPPAAAPAPLQITLQLEDPRVLAFLDAAKINGIRAAADDAKLLMNNKVFRVGGVVDRELGLKLVQILPTELVFEDARGIQYHKIL